MTFAEWIVLATVCFAGASSPGPSLALLIRAVIRGGRPAGIAFSLAHGVGILLYAGLVTIGLGAVLVLMPFLFTLLEIAGILFLFWLATGMVRAGLSPTETSTETKTAPPRSVIQEARDGFMIVFLNPKVAVFFLAIFSQFLDKDQGAEVQLLMVMTAFIIDTGWYVLMAAVIAMPALLRLLEKQAHRLELIIGLGLLVISGLLVWRLSTGL